MTENNRFKTFMNDIPDVGNHEEFFGERIHNMSRLQLRKFLNYMRMIVKERDDKIKALEDQITDKDSATDASTV